nr:restriction endonuclease subunit S [Marinobacter sp. SS5-14b]
MTVLSLILRLIQSLPSGWAGATLSHLGVFSGGKTPSKSRSEFWNGDIPWVTPKDMKSAEIATSEDHVTQDALNAGGLALLPENAVLFVVRSGILRRMFPTAVTRVQCTINQDLKALQLFKPEMARYIQVLSWGFERFILEKLTKTGTTVESLKFGDFANQPFPLPPLEEQHRIVQKVDELMALCDRLEQQTSDQLEAHETLVDTLLDTLTQSENTTELADNWARLAAHFDTLFTTEQSIDKLKQTILQLAVMGRLVEQDVGDESAEQLIERIAAQKAETGNGKRRTSKPPKSGTAESQPFQIPSTWAWVPLRQTGLTSTGKTPSTKNASFFSGDIPFIGPGQVTAAGKINAPEKHLSEEGILQSEEALPGDILTVCIGGSIGKTAIVTERCGFNQQLNKIRPVLVQPRYLLAAINADFFQHSIREKATGSATPIINRSKWESIAIPLAPLTEQKRIVQKVDELMALCDQLKERINQASEARCQLAEAVVENALN